MSESKVLRVLIVVSGGVAGYMFDDDVDVALDIEVFDWDNYKDDPIGTEGVPEHFRDLVAGTDIPVGATLEERFPESDWRQSVMNGDTKRGYQEWAEAQAEESSHA
jgi:hypothetical protein